MKEEKKEASLAQDLIDADMGHLVIATGAYFGPDGPRFYSMGREIKPGNQPGQAKLEQEAPTG